MTTLSEQQQEIADDIINSDSARITLAGLAGTGKTTVLKYVYDQWRAKRLKVCVIAPSAKAAMVLRAKGVPATTIHSAIYHYRGQFETIEGDTELIFKDNNNGQFCDRLLVDETSMVTRRQLDDIQSRDIPTLFCGDPGQLKPVKSKPTGLLDRPNFLLTEIHRQAADNPIIQYAYEVRKGASLAKRHDGVDHVSVNGRGSMFVAAEMIERKIDRLIVRTNAQRVAINQSYRVLTDRKGTVAVGDEVLCIANNKYLNIVNGESFRVLGIIDEFPSYTTARVYSVDTGRNLNLSLWNSQFGQEQKITEEIQQCFALADYSYAITCHKAQGSSWGHVAVAAKGSDWADDSKEWAYTAVTRAENNLTIFC